MYLYAHPMQATKIFTCGFRPLDLCDATASSSDLLPIGHQSSHASGLPMPNQGAVGSMLPNSGPNSSLQVSPGVGLGNSASPSGPLNAPIRWYSLRPLCAGVFDFTIAMKF